MNYSKGRLPCLVEVLVKFLQLSIEAMCSKLLRPAYRILISVRISCSCHASDLKETVLIDFTELLRDMNYKPKHCGLINCPIFLTDTAFPPVSASFRNALAF